jgi:ATP-dependent DNA helicase RecQ
VIASVMSGEPTLAVMPTGGGKSLCYQIPALLLPGTTIVVSPLIALMKDQHDKLRERGVAAWQLNSALAAAEVDAAEQAIARGEAKIVFTTPERLAEPEFLERLAATEIGLFVIDEAHCISQWGHDFRPAFLEIGPALARLGRPRVLALTATATDAVSDDIAKQLGVGRFRVVNTGMYRPNLHYSVIQVTRESEKLARAVELVRDAEGAGLVYAATVKAAEEVHAALRAAGVASGLYHGKLSAARRHEAQDAFMDGSMRVMVATNAFGLGIDKPDTRFVLHYQMPGGLDAYYQESGRAGRDGDDARCLLLFMHADKAVQQFFMAGKYPSREDLASLYVALLRERGDGEAWTLERLQEALDRPKAKLQVGLRLLRHQRVVRQHRDGRLELTRAGLDDKALETLLAGYREKRESDRAMLERMVFYGQTGQCRWKVLLEPFGEAEDFGTCGHCDNCLRMALAVATAESEAAAAAAEGEQAAPAPSPSARPPFSPGDAVRVARYGAGVVEAIDGEGVTVRFLDGPARTFLADYVRPAKGTGPAGASAKRSAAGLRVA